jgi:hypothetical protein
VERRNKPRKKHNEAEEDWSGSYRIACVPCLLWFWSCFVGGRDDLKALLGPATKKKEHRRCIILNMWIGLSQEFSFGRITLRRIIVWQIC